MGMFDEIFCKKELPLPDEIKEYTDWKNFRFQTKDLENCLLEYIIEDDGILYETVIEREYIEYSEEERKSVKPWNLWKDVIEKSRTNEKLDYHGKIRFYTYENLNDEYDFMVDFDAYFIYGKLDKIELAEFKKYPCRSKEYDRWQDELKIQQSKLSYKIYKVIKKCGWSAFLKFLNKILYNFEGIISKTRYFLIRIS